jgi:hypothetical protein
MEPQFQVRLGGQEGLQASAITSRSGVDGIRWSDMAVWLCGVFLSAGSTAVGGPVGWFGSATSFPVLATSCLPAGASARYRATWLSKGWDTTGVGEAGPLGGGEGASGLSWLLDQEPGGRRGGEQAGLDLVAGQDATGDQAVETDPGLVQGVIAAAFGGVGDGGQFLRKHGAAVRMAT